ncbi:hypothetical protein D9619_007284 [Psilocybe cf. subviscida]|uniref:Homeobox domain-containing protein n=1 Tax=Psilocybe cf. subviscida TaxID=2480587 RepID=A0A8H5B2H3_9AGAR|nr:hypothetical protein D9619_007284 [Psilocybe cf. subviscida]
MPEVNKPLTTFSRFVSPSSHIGPVGSTSQDSCLPKMSQNETSLTNAKPTRIRASRAQSAILKAAFAVSNNVSQDVLQDLAAQTGLPPKWISSWFGRAKRSKVRNSLGEARSTSAVALSPAEIASVKSEFGDPGSSPFSDASVFGKDNEISSTIPASSFSSGLKTFSFVPANAVTLRSTSHLQHSSVAAERPLSTINLYSEDLHYTPPPNDGKSHPSATGTLAKSWNEQAFSMNIAPPKRSPMHSTGRGVNHSTQCRPSNLVNDLSDSIYSSFLAAGASSTPMVDLGPKMTRRLPGSGLRAAPHEEVENVPLVPHTQTLDFTRAPGEHAFPWTANLHISQAGLANAVPLKDSLLNRNVDQVTNTPLGSASWTNAPRMHPSVAHYIDPTKAPLKHLTELLLEFKDENGDYSKLLAVEEDAKLRKILLDDISVDEDPFLAAMALSLLAGLGFNCCLRTSLSEDVIAVDDEVAGLTRAEMPTQSRPLTSLHLLPNTQRRLTMSARFARNAFTAASRRAHAYGSTASRRAMSSTSHAAETVKKDTPWVVGSLLIFGPAFLYLVSPSARKNPNLKPIHDDKHDFPALKTHDEAHEEPAPTPKKTVMKDDEGTPADVGASIKAAADSDVPKASVSPEENAEDKEAAAEEPSADSADSAKSEKSESGTSPKDVPKSDVSQKEGTLQKEGETEGSTDQGPAREASSKGQDPKEAAEKTPQEDKVKKGNEA